MGFIDPMAFGNAVTTGGLELGSGPLLWALTLGLLAATAVAIALSAWHPWRPMRVALAARGRRRGGAVRLLSRAT